VREYHGIYREMESADRAHVEWLKEQIRKEGKVKRS